MNLTGTRDDRKLTYEELSAFYNELSLLYESGISISQALDIMSASAGDTRTGALCSQLVAELDQGQTPADAMDHVGVFPAHAIQMMRVGHASGSMETVLTGLTSFYQRQDSLNRSIRSALTFPLIMVSVMFCVLLVLIIKVLPLFGAVYAETGAHMPWILRMITGSTGFTAGLIIALTVILAILIYVFLQAGEVMTSDGDPKGVLASLPVIRDLCLRTQTSSVAHSMALLMAGGIPVEQALEDMCEMTESARIRSLCTSMHDAMLDGSTFADAASACNIFDHTSCALLLSAEKAGHVDEMMDYIAGKYAADTEHRIDGLLGMIEPVLVIIMSLLIGSILLSILLPLMNVMMNI